MPALHVGSNQSCEYLLIAGISESINELVMHQSDAIVTSYLDAVTSSSQRHQESHCNSLQSDRTRNSRACHRSLSLLRHRPAFRDKSLRRLAATTTARSPRAANYRFAVADGAA